MDARDLISFFLVSLSAVFFVVDPIGVVPIFLAMTSGTSPTKIREIAMRASFAGGALLLAFALFGGLIFKTFGVSLAAFRVAGGLLLLVTSFDMVRAKTSQTKTSPQETQEGIEKDDIAVVPLAIPLLSGPGSIATVMVLMSQAKGWAGPTSILLSIALTFVASYFLLRGAHLVQRVLKQTGVAIMQRVMGLILAAIAVQFVAEGSRDLLGLR